MIYCSYRNNCGIWLHDGDLEHSLMKEKKIDLHIFFFPFLCPAIPDIELGVLKIYLLHVFVMYYNQQSVNLFLAWYDSQPICTVNLQYLQ